MKGPMAVAVDADSNLHVADKHNHWVRRIDASGAVTRVAGSGSSGYGGDGGAAVRAELESPDRVVLDSRGNLYIADTDNDRVQRIDPSGSITTAAGLSRE